MRIAPDRLISDFTLEPLSLCLSCRNFTGYARQDPEQVPAHIREEQQRGPLVLVPGTEDVALFRTYCDCERPPGSARTVPTPGVFGTETGECFGLCLVCAMVVLNTSNRFSFVLCAECRTVVAHANTFAGRLLFPVSRHSLVNTSGAAGRLSTAPLPTVRGLVDHPELLIEQVQVQEAGADLLARWRESVFERNLAEGGLAADGRPPRVPVLTYLAACRRAKLASDVRAIQLVRTHCPWR